MYASHLLNVILGHIDHRAMVWIDHHFPLCSSWQPTIPDKLLPPATADRIDHKQMTHTSFNPLHTYIEVLIVCFTSAQSQSWPHWPQGGGVNFFVTLLCCHLGKPHTPHYLISTCLLSLLTTLTTKKWHVFSFDPLQAHIKVLIACFTSA